jgi:hypothetical protein
LVLSKSESISQTVLDKDSVTAIPNFQLKKAINIIEKGKVTQKELDFTKEKVVVLESRIQNKDSIIYKFNEKEVIWNKIDSNYQKEIANFNQIISNDKKIFDRQQLLILRGKWGKWLFLAAGIGSGILLHR